MTVLVTIAIAGLAVLVVSAVVIGVVESAQASAWRRIAAQRRKTWERRQQLHGRPRYVESWADEDTD